MIEMTHSLVRELLDYNPDTGVMIWRNRDLKWFKSKNSWSSWNSRFAGKRAGCLWTNPRTGYQRRDIRIWDVRYCEHRLVWMYMTDAPLPPQIDHINRDARDNRWINLKASSPSDNSRNRSRTSRNTSGVTGVSWHKRVNKWHAYCGVGKNVSHLGYFDNIEEAESALLRHRAKHGYSDEHGRDAPHYY